uniref:ARAD1D13552p n=1 Tax=Blastobotrys adeninivorans TaxID=409370 RepID=A0A060T985_BLAAD
MPSAASPGPTTAMPDAEDNGKMDDSKKPGEEEATESRKRGSISALKLIPSRPREVPSDQTLVPSDQSGNRKASLAPSGTSNKRKSVLDENGLLKPLVAAELAPSTSRESRVSNMSPTNSASPSARLSPTPSKGWSIGSVETSRGRRALNRLSQTSAGYGISQGIATMRRGLAGDRAGRGRDVHAIGFEIYDSEDDDEAEVNSIMAMDPNKPQAISDTVVLDRVVENQRGWFLFGFPFFSSGTLMPNDPAPYTTPNGKSIGGDMSVYLLPDRSWDWKWKRWYVDMSGDVDDQGWTYSIRFGSGSWHGSHIWFHSFVRKRSWVRLRQKRKINPRAVFSAAVLNDTDSALNYNAATAGSSTREDSSRDTTPDSVGDIVNSLRACRLDRERIRTIVAFLLNPKSVATVHALTEVPATNQLNSYREILDLFDYKESQGHLVKHLTRALSEQGPALSSRHYEALDRFTKALAQQVEDTGFYCHPTASSRPTSQVDAANPDKGDSD